MSLPEPKPANSHSIISPAILYWGTPVVLVSSENEDGTTNIAPISSAFWLGNRCILGFGAGSKTPQNILRSKQCVLNLPDDSMTAPVNALASTTGTEHPSATKLSRGYRYVKDKWTCANLTPQPADFVKPARVRECPVQMECQFVGTYSFMQDTPDQHGVLISIEVKVLRTHIVDDLRMVGYANRIDPDKWRPMFMSFQELYGLRDGKLAKSSLARVDEEQYRGLTVSSSGMDSSPGSEDQHISNKLFAEHIEA